MNTLQSKVLDAINDDAIRMATLDERRRATKIIKAVGGFRELDALHRVICVGVTMDTSEHKVITFYCKSEYLDVLCERVEVDLITGYIVG